MTDKAVRMVTIHRGGGKPLRMYLPNGGVERSDECYDDPNGTHILVKRETWERMVDTDKINQHRVADAFWRVWNEVGEPHKHGFYESTWMAIRAALSEIGEAGDE